MEITVGCACGSKFTFEEETVNGRVRWPVTCPNCGVDDTNLANEYIQRMLSGELEREQKKNSSWWQKLFGGKKAAAAGEEQEREFRFAFGVVGASVGAAIGFTAWYLIRRWAGIELGVVAWGIGGLVGFGARFAAGGGSFGLAGVASAAAIAAIMGGQYWTVHQVIADRLPNTSAAAYNLMHEYAERGSKASSGEEVADLLDHFSYRPGDVAPGENPVLCQKRLALLLGLSFGRVMQDGTTPTVREYVEETRERPEVTAADIAAFRKTEQPALRDFLKGKPSEGEFKNAVESMARKNLSVNKMIVHSWGRYTFLWIFLGVGTAWRLAYDKWETEF